MTTVSDSANRDALSQACAGDANTHIRQPLKEATSRSKNALRKGLGSGRDRHKDNILGLVTLDYERFPGQPLNALQWDKDLGAATLSAKPVLSPGQVARHLQGCLILCLAPL